ncbi:TonB-dependent receptor domain-containing protein [Massilia glaciei]|uniref:TonB-dependent receptor n=1 Tax=Massilia glaciei TaxID=1524097 RepID=A0A2U2I452_9BURK|nr:TonB-dependent receptor [Massilia glaciei]PWF54558.1 TonB-dependent receptor [Massilia glaciei]
MISLVSQHRAAALTSLALSGLALAPALAQTAPSQVVVTATRVAQPASEVLSDHVLIGADEIAAAGQVSIAELLQKTRGIEISSNGGSANYASVFLRGASNSQSIVLVDGVRVGSAANGGATWAAIPLAQVDRIEIIYGPLSSLYGADAMGGVVQIFTKRGAHGAAPAPTLTLGAGSDGRRRLDAGVSGAAGALRYAFQLASERSDEFSASTPDAGPYTYNPDRDGYERRSASGNLSYALARGHELGAQFMHSRLASQFDAGPGFDDHSLEKLASASFWSHNRILPNWNSKLQFSHADDKSASYASYGDGFIDTEQTGLLWQNDVTLGTDLLQVVLEHRKEEVLANLGAISRARSTRSLALAYQLRRGAHLGTASVRRDDNSQFGVHNTGSLAYGYRIGGGLRASASVGTSFRAPTFNELYYPGFGVAANRPEKGRNAELGLAYARGATQLTASLYRNRLTDLLVYAPTCPVEVASHPYGCAYNINQATLEGLSLGARTAWNGFMLNGSLDFQDPVDDTTGKRLARRSGRHGSVGLDYGIGKFKVGADALFSGARFNDGAELARLPGYGLLNLRASYALGGQWSVFGNLNNAGDKRYALAKGYATAGRTVFVGLRYGAR